MFPATNLIFHVEIFNVFIIITGLKYPLDYQRRDANKVPKIPIARVLHGEDADRLEYAYVVALERFPGKFKPEYNYTFYRKCTGSLINKNFVISAAHCSEGADRIRYGDLTVPSWSTRASHSNITRKFNHIKYEDQEWPYHLTGKAELRFIHMNDIVLYKVEPVHLSKYAVLSAVDYKTLTGLSVHYVGCGTSYTLDMNESEMIKRIVQDETRERQIGYAMVKPCGKLSGTALAYPCICLAHKCDSIQIVLPGDSGGPLLYAGKIVGVAKGLYPTDGTRIPQAVYTPISVYLDWITQVVYTEN